MKFHRSLLPLIMLCTLLLIAIPAGAQEIDLGSDGVDMDCDDFPERNAVEGYFTHDGESAERNVDGLDSDGDGIPCNEAQYVDGEDDRAGPDLGNDGVDMNCEDFAEFNAVNGYFIQDGGSAERNVDNLDPNGDGIPCNEIPIDPGEEGHDLGNDGIDMDCDDFPERNAVEGYFAHDGGSAERNVDGLDPDGDGIPCNEEDYDGKPGTDTGSNPIDPDGAETGDTGGEVERAAPVMQLPVTGTGSADRQSGAGLLVLMATLTVVTGAMLVSVRLRRTG